MTVSTTDYLIQYNGDGSTTTFAYDFSIAADADLVVETLDTSDSTADPVTQTLTTDYTVTGAGSASGGDVVFGTAPDSNTRITIYRDTEATQETDYTAYDTFPEESHESALDKLTRIVQETRGKLARALQFSASEDRSGGTKVSTVPTPDEDKALVWDADGNLTNGSLSSASTDTDVDALITAGDKGKRLQASTSEDGYVLVGDAIEVAGTDTLTGSIGLDGYNDNQVITIKAAATNTGAVTLNLDSLGAKAVTLSDGSALPAGSLEAGKLYHLWYDGTNFVVLNPSVSQATAEAGTQSEGAMPPERVQQHFDAQFASAPSGYTKAGILYVRDTQSLGKDVLADISFVSGDGNVTYGPSGTSGTQWTRLDDLPSGTKAILVRFTNTITAATADTLTYQRVYAEPGSLAADTNHPVCTQQYASAATPAATRTVDEAIIPLDSNFEFNVRVQQQNISTDNLYMELKGFYV